jgi:hypothetical protein
LSTEAGVVRLEKRTLFVYTLGNFVDRDASVLIEEYDNSPGEISIPPRECP